MGSRRLALAMAIVGAAVVGCAGDPPPPATSPTSDGTQDGSQAQGDVAVDDFTEPLSNYGTWIDDDTYGKIWQPADDMAGPDFVPYTSDGTWVANEDGGWVFQSKYDTEWGWATYHYGRWFEHDDYGWVWVPGTEWAPAWVDWRYGGGYVGWAPMAPEGVVINENRWLFVEERRMGDPGGAWSFRLQPERIHAVFTAAAPIERSGGGGKFSIGPAFDKIKAAGGAFKSLKASAPARGALKAMAKAATSKAASSNRPKQTASAAQATVRRGPNAGTKVTPSARASAGSAGGSAGKAAPMATPSRAAAAAVPSPAAAPAGRKAAVESKATPTPVAKPKPTPVAAPAAKPAAKATPKHR